MWTSGKRAYALGSFRLLLTAVAPAWGTGSTPSSGTVPVRTLEAEGGLAWTGRVAPTALTFGTAALRPAWQA